MRRFDVQGVEIDALDPKTLGRPSSELLPSSQRCHPSRLALRRRDL